MYHIKNKYKSLYIQFLFIVKIKFNKGIFNHGFGSSSFCWPSSISLFFWALLIIFLCCLLLMCWLLLRVQYYVPHSSHFSFLFVSTAVCLATRFVWTAETVCFSYFKWWTCIPHIHFLYRPVNFLFFACISSLFLWDWLFLWCGILSRNTMTPHTHLLAILLFIP